MRQNTDLTIITTTCCSPNHYGRLLEQVIRRNSMSISEIARRLFVSRRTLYKWFEQETLEIDLLEKIGTIINYDFEKDFPEEFAQKKSRKGDDAAKGTPTLESLPENQVYYWMDKYITLLEKINAILLRKNSARD